VPSVLHSVNELVTESRTLPSAALGKGFFAECPTKSTRQSDWHSAKARIPVVTLGSTKFNTSSLVHTFSLCSSFPSYIKKDNYKRSKDENKFQIIILIPLLSYDL
jgi:hypothetical protein